MIKQSSISVLLIYLGAAIGLVNTLVLLPMFLTTEQIGLLRAIPAAAFLILPLAHLGLSASFLKFAPEFKQKTQGLTELFSFCLLMALGGFAIITGMIYLFDEPIAVYFVQKSPLLKDYLSVVVLLLLLFSVHSLFETYVRWFLKVIALNLIKEVLIRLLFTLGMSLYFLGVISFPTLVYGLIAIYGLALGALVIYVFGMGQFKFSFRFTLIDRRRLKRMSVYAFFMLLASGSSGIIMNIDQVMIASTLGLSKNGVYTTVFYFAACMEMFRRPIQQVTTSILSEALEKKDFKAVDKLYKQISINQMIIGGLLFIGITCNLDSVFALMPNGDDYASGKYVVYLIGLLKLVDVSFANGAGIIALSPYYKFNVVVVGLLAVSMVGLNAFLIPAYGISGAALASLISVTLLCVIKMTFVKMKFNLFPFTWKNLAALCLGGATFVVGQCFPSVDVPLADIAIKSVVITLIYGAGVYFLNLSQEVNRLVKQVVSGCPWLK